jgi:hypothetical protein
VVSSYNDEKQRHSSTLQEVRLLGEINTKALSALEKVTSEFIESADCEKRAIELAVKEKRTVALPSSPSSSTSSVAAIGVVTEITQPIGDAVKTDKTIVASNSLEIKSPEYVDDIIKAAEDDSDKARTEAVSKEQKKTVDSISSSFVYPSEPALSVAKRIARIDRYVDDVFMTLRNTLI